ncbi:hypothetical protein SteCoe_26089 [Stentor coeruleus]|uniref:CCR4-NOT transcription complex subunit 11 n=1 Tax=Stentor coeruleus TaxID=5963 RepID=A0A1R2BDQ2_9CILI|nr:hypothetical protein SteCoe_26089 [Stentor coeruleus]
MQDLSKLHCIIEHQILKEKTLDGSYQAFLKLFPKTHNFQEANEILAWLQDDFLAYSERINAIYILLELSKHLENMFLKTIVDFVDISPHPWEKLFLQEWFKNKEIGKTAVSNILQLSEEDKEIDNIKQSKTVKLIQDFIETSPIETNLISTLTISEVLSDNESQKERETNEEVRELLKISLTNKLSNDQTDTVITALRSDSEIAFKSGISHENLGDLVEKNLIIAFEIISSIMHSSKVTDYFIELLNIPMGPNSLEVLYRLALTMELPADFLHLYIFNCFHTCRNTDDRHAQIRLVRLLCVIISFLLKNKVLNSYELFIDIEQFCVDFVTIKDTVLLCELVKPMTKK